MPHWMLTAKFQLQLPTGALVHKAHGDALNTPVIADATGQNGWLYKASTAGVQNWLGFYKLWIL